MPTMINKECEWCNSTITVRQADVDRGWGKFCNKSCKAKFQENKKHEIVKPTNFYNTNPFSNKSSIF